jgi:putative flippase GtrA
MFPAMGMRFHPETLAHAIGVAVPVFTSYFGHKALTFKERPA